MVLTFLPEPQFVCALKRAQSLEGEKKTNFNERPRFRSGKLELDVRRLLPPTPNWITAIDSVRGGRSWNRCIGMEWANQHGCAHYSSRPGIGSDAVARASHGGTGRSGRTGLQFTPETRTGQSQAQASPKDSSYSDRRYTEQNPYGGSSVQSTLPTGQGLQSFDPKLPRGQQALQQEDSGSSQTQPESFIQYNPGMMYALNLEDQAQSPYDIVPQYQTRQSAAIEDMTDEFAVPQLFSPNEPTATGDPAAVSPYVTPHVHSSPYNHPGAGGHSSTVDSFSATNMADFTPAGTVEHEQLNQAQQQGQFLHQPQQQPQRPQRPPGPSATSIDEAYDQFEKALRYTFDIILAGRLVEASRALLEISDWLVTNARELGLLRDDQLTHEHRLQLWNDFNMCWLAMCQRQKDMMMQDILSTGNSPPNTSLLDSEAMENMGNELVRFCDRLEEHGLVDYQMGIWEEEILCVLGQCLDLFENSNQPKSTRRRSNLHGAGTQEGATATPTSTPRSMA